MGKAQSLLEGFSYATYELICMIDSDLQYTPEVLPEMLQLTDDGYSVIIANRKEAHTHPIRTFISKSFNFIFCRLLHGLPYDVQSGFKLFRKEIIERISIRPLPWSFDLEFLLAARAGGYQITSVDVTFNKRKSGSSKVNIFWTSLQIGVSAILLKLKSDDIIPFHKNRINTDGQGFHYKKKEFIHYSDLSFKESAVKVFFAHQLFVIAFILSIFVIGLAINWEKTLIIFVAILTVIYFIDLLFNFFLIYRSLIFRPEIEIDEEKLKIKREWPQYTIFCPLYKEWSVIQQFVHSINNLDYPKDKLQVQVLLEEDDKETLEYVKNTTLPSYIDVIVVPHSLPKTKPKACNYGLRVAKGEYAVIYDAEDIPDKLQLKKAVLAFELSEPHIVCIQAKLNYYNRSQNLLTRLFTAEYSLWFDLILTGLQSVGAPIPLGGTSNHFRVEQLRKVKGWDSFNVTEDCDLGIRLAKQGYLTAIINSDTLEEANSDVNNWINQRSRWIKGYMQTYLVHMRDPMEFLRSSYKSHLTTFQLVVGGKILSLFINPFMWATTILYFALRAYIGPAIEQIFPGVIFYLAVFSLIVGNFLYMYYYMIGCYQRKQYELLKFVFFVPLYWLGMSIATWKALLELIIKPHYWQKTKHGLHLESSPKLAQIQFQNDIPQQVEGAQIPKTGKVHQLFLSGGILVIASVIANLLNYIYSGYLSRAVNVEEFGVISLISNFLFLTVIPLESLSSSIIYRSAYYLGKYKKSLTEFWKKIRVTSMLAGFVVSIIWVLATPTIARFFNTDNTIPFYLFAPVWLFNTMLAVDLGYLTGNHRFNAIALVTLLAPFIKTISAIALVTYGLEEWVYASIPLSIVVASALSYLLVSMMPKATFSESDTHLLTFPTKYFFVTALSRFSLVSYLTLDVLLAKHFLPPTEAGKYALIALIGKMIFFVGGLFNQFITPLVSRDLGVNSEKQPSFKILFIASAFTSWIAYIIFGILGEITAPLLLGNNIDSVSHLLPIYGVGVFAFSIASSIIAYHLVKKAHTLAVTTFVLSIAQLIAFYIFHDSIEQIVTTIAIIGVLNLVIAILYHVFENSVNVILNNTTDFLSLLKPLPKTEVRSKENLRVLILNWRDTKHVWAGGAETYIHGIAKHMVAKGHIVTIFCGNDAHSKRYEEIDGIQIIRRGGFYTVYFWAFIYYILRLRGNYDIIIDSMNGLPFFSPLYASIPVVGLIHHVHQEVFREHLPVPLALFACFLEAKVMPTVYRKKKMITVSDSTQNSMKHIGFPNKKEIDIVYPGIEPNDYAPGKKTSYPSLLYLGRLKKYKSIHALIEAMAEIIKEVPKTKLTIAGFGESKDYLSRLAESLGISEHINFTGRVSDKTKSQLLSESWVFVQPSFMEGWGITAIEASASGTAVVASDIPGLRDSVQNEKTGYLVPYGKSDEFAKAILNLLKSKQIRTTLENNGIEWTKKFS